MSIGFNSQQNSQVCIDFMLEIYKLIVYRGRSLEACKAALNVVSSRIGARSYNSFEFNISR